jgi:4,5-dihydroxyphthalate decarboxylase
MTLLQLDIASGFYDRVEPVASGRVKPEGIDPSFIFINHPREIFWRMIKHEEFDVSEMSLATYVASVSRGDERFIGIPIFLSRAFRHGSIFVNANSGIKEPSDLVGKRIGAPEYGMTALVWVRGILQEQYGIKPNDLKWYVGPRERLPRKLSDGPEITVLQDEKMLGSMLVNGELDALIAPRVPDPFRKGSDKIRRLFPNYRELELAYYQETKMFPIMHLMVVKSDIYRQHKWVATSLYRAFNQAKELAISEMYEAGSSKVTLPWVPGEIESSRSLMGNDYWPYGVEANRANLETFLRYMADQGLLERSVEIEELFAPETVEMFS